MHLWIELGNSLEGRSRCDFLGTWGDAIVETDVYLDLPSTGKNGIVTGQRDGALRWNICLYRRMHNDKQ